MSASAEGTVAHAGSASVVTHEGHGVYASLFDKINLNPVSQLSNIEVYQNSDALSEASADERVTAAVSVFLDLLKQSSQKVERLDKTLLDEHIASLDAQISRQLDAVMHHEDFQRVESTWRGVKSLIDQTDFRRNVRIELLDISKDHLVQDFEDAPEIAQSGLYVQTYTQEYDTPGGEPIAAAISNYEFGRGPQDIALLRNISKVAAAAHMPFIGSVGPAFFGKESMEEVAAIKDIGNYFDRAEYLKWKSFRDSDDSRYIGLIMPRVLGRLPYGPDTVPVRSFNYIESVKGPDHKKYLWTNASFAFAANMVKSFINNGWCVQIRGPQAGGAVSGHLRARRRGQDLAVPAGPDRPGHTGNGQPHRHAGFAFPRAAQRHAPADAKRRGHWGSGEAAGTEHPGAGDAALAAQGATGATRQPVADEPGEPFPGHSAGKRGRGCQ